MEGGVGQHVKCQETNLPSKSKPSHPARAPWRPNPNLIVDHRSLAEIISDEQKQPPDAVIRAVSVFSSPTKAKSRSKAEWHHVSQDYHSVFMVIDMDGYTAPLFKLQDKGVVLPDFVHDIREIYKKPTTKDSPVFICRELAASKFIFGTGGTIRKYASQSKYFEPPRGVTKWDCGTAYHHQFSKSLLPFPPNRRQEKPLLPFGELPTVIKQLYEDLVQSTPYNNPVVGYKGGTFEKEILEILNIPHCNLEEFPHCAKVEDLIHSVRQRPEICNMEIHRGCSASTLHCPQLETEVFIQFIWDFKKQKLRQIANKKKGFIKRYNKRQLRRRQLGQTATDE